ARGSRPLSRFSGVRKARCWPRGDRNGGRTHFATGFVARAAWRFILMVKDLISPRPLLNVCPREGRYATGKLTRLSTFIAGLLPDLPFARPRPYFGPLTAR